ncbi:uncharacterized protein LOC113347132 [Papaver somniferum]|uniref:uncharacterized protein LOC113347132 n=1 Tax=Papaver somniferum TaxID=3469 RepID=UPI000E6F6887|nr:uncharacterized protein LOC113347132 [Papaver somniferum]
MNCKATIRGIKKSSEWYYSACQKCKGRHAIVDNTQWRYSCNEEVKTPEIRLLLKLRVKDENDASIFVVHGETAEQLTAIQLNEIKACIDEKNKEKQRNLRRAIAEKIRGYQCIFNLEVNTPNPTSLILSDTDSDLDESSTDSDVISPETPSKKKCRRKLIMISDGELEETKHPEVMIISDDSESEETKHPEVVIISDDEN